jgi:hypothetical protein
MEYTLLIIMFMVLSWCVIAAFTYRSAMRKANAKVAELEQFVKDSISAEARANGQYMSLWPEVAQLKELVKKYNEYVHFTEGEVYVRSHKNWRVAPFRPNPKKDIDGEPEFLRSNDVQEERQS